MSSPLWCLTVCSTVPNLKRHYTESRCSVGITVPDAEMIKAQNQAMLYEVFTLSKRAGHKADVVLGHIFVSGFRQGAQVSETSLVTAILMTYKERCKLEGEGQQRQGRHQQGRHQQGRKQQGRKQQGRHQ